MLLSAAATEDKEKTEPVVWVLVRSRPYFVRVRRRDITVTEDSAVSRPPLRVLLADGSAVAHGAAREDSQAHRRVAAAAATEAEAGGGGEGGGRGVAAHL